MGIKNFVPPVVVNFIRKNKKITKYKSYEEALMHCTVNAYQNEELCKMIAEKTFLYIESLKGKPFALNPTTVYLAFALNYFVNISGKRSITVLDFGGACGAHYFEVRHALPSTLNLKWVVVETEQMVRSAVSRGLNNGELNFVSRIEEVPHPVDFLHSSSTLQYVPAPFEVLNRLVELNARMVLFNRMMFNTNYDDIITVQQSYFSSNGPGKMPAGYADKLIMYPHTTVSIHKTNSVMRTAGYECLSEFDEASGTISLGREKILGKGLLYIKKDI